MTPDPLPFDDLSRVLSLEDLRGRIELLIEDYGYEALRTEIGYFAPGRSVGSAPARSTDPETSHFAAKRSIDVGRFSAKSRQAKLLDLFQMRDLTDQQATIHLVGSHAAPSAFDGCRRRCSDLRAAGLLYDTGRRRKNAGSDDDSIIWGITDAGKRALRSLDDTGWSR
jgi:hypothetical protein